MQLPEGANRQTRLVVEWANQPRLAPRTRSGDADILPLRGEREGGQEVCCARESIDWRCKPSWFIR